MLPLTLITVIVVYGIALVIIATHATDLWAQWLSSVIFWIFALESFYMLYHFIGILLAKRIRNSRRALWRLLDLYISLVHGIAGIGFSMYVLDSSIGKQAFFLNIDNTASMYSIYVADFLSPSILIVNTVGFSTVQVRPSVVLPALWAAATSILGWIVLGFVLVLITQNFGKSKSRTKHKKGDTTTTTTASIMHNTKNSQRLDHRPQLLNPPE